MNAPAFWSAPPGLLARCLAPFGWIYGAITAWRMGRKGRRVGVPVVCIGNFTAGGAGKTPTVISLAAMLGASGETPVVVSRGYGGRIVGPERVDLETMSAVDCGDEPLLVARHVTVIVSRDRAAGAEMARSFGATVVLLDDGLQNPGLEKDFSLAVIDGGAGLGNGYCIPAGPLRAPVMAQLAHVDAILIIGRIANDAGALGALKSLGKPVFSGALKSRAADRAAVTGKKLYAFAGIGRPEKFFQTLEDSGLSVSRTRGFPDHYMFTTADLAALHADAAKEGLTLVTTEKDAVRLPREERQIARFGVDLELTDGELPDMIRQRLRLYRAQL